MLLEKNLWKSHIWVDTKVRLYSAYVLLVLVMVLNHGQSQTLVRHLGAYNTWSLCKILWIPYTRHQASGCTPVRILTQARWLRFWSFQAGWLIGHQCIASTSKSLEETSRAPTCRLAEWIDADVQSANTGIHSGVSSALVTYHWHGNTSS